MIMNSRTKSETAPGAVGKFWCAVALAWIPFPITAAVAAASVLIGFYDPTTDGSMPLGSSLAWWSSYVAECALGVWVTALLIRKYRVGELVRVADGAIVWGWILQLPVAALGWLLGELVG